MLQYLDDVLIPYVTSKRNDPTQAALLICDVFAAHRVQSFKDKLESNNIELIYVPAGCTGKAGEQGCPQEFHSWG